MFILPATSDHLSRVTSLSKDHPRQVITHHVVSKRSVQYTKHAHTAKY